MRPPYGRTVDIASMGGVVPFLPVGACHATRSAVLGLTDALAQDVEPLGIRVTSVLPGLLATDWCGRSQARTESRITDDRWSADREPPEMTGHLTALAGAVMTLLDADNPPFDCSSDPRPSR